MSAGILDLTLEQGATFTAALDLTDSADDPINLTGYVVRAQLRAYAGASDVLAAFTVAVPSPATGHIDLSLSAEVTAGIRATGANYASVSQYAWDMELEVGGVVTRLLNGSVLVSPEVTRG